MSELPKSLPGLKPEKRSPDTNASDCLGSWKEIAAYLKRDLRTVQRWEKREGLPVHRHRHDERASVFAFKSELDGWWQNEYLQLEIEEKQSSSLPSAIEPVEAAPRTEANPFLSNRWKLVAAAAVVIAVAAGLFLVRYRRRTPPLTERDTIVIGDFANSTGDPVFDGTLRQGLIVQLEQSPFLSLISDERIRQTLRLMEKPPDTKLTPLTARDLCQRVGGKACIAGSIANLGNKYVIGLSAVNCITGDSLGQEQVQARGKEQVLESLSRAATKLRATLGESLSTIQRLDMPLPQATTSSLEALRSYSLSAGLRDAQAVPLLRRAIELDPNFAAAYDNLGLSLNNMGESEAGADSIRKAFELKARASDREQLGISEDYYAGVTGQIEKAIEIAQLELKTYPRDSGPYGFVGAEYMWLGQYESARAAIAAQMKANPTEVGYANLEETYLALNRFADARAAVGQARTRFVHHGFFSSYELAFLRGDTATMRKELASAEAPAEDPEDSELMELTQADTETYFGRVNTARRFTEKAVHSAQQKGRSESAALWFLQQGLREAEVGFARQSVRDATAALALSRASDVRVLAGIVLARAGDLRRAESLASVIDRKFPMDSITRTYWNTSARAAIALQHENAGLALALLETASPVELSGWTIWPNATTMYPVYLRGQAYLASRQGPQAAEEFQKILDHRGLILNCPIGALAHLGLARAYAMSGDTAKAKAAYQEFLTLWKDADPDVPVLKQAKAEYAKLKQSIRPAL